MLVPANRAACPFVFRDRAGRAAELLQIFADQQRFDEDQALVGTHLRDQRWPLAADGVMV